MNGNFVQSQYQFVAIQNLFYGKSASGISTQAFRKLHDQGLETVFWPVCTDKMNNHTRREWKAFLSSITKRSKYDINPYNVQSETRDNDCFILKNWIVLEEMGKRKNGEEDWLLLIQSGSYLLIGVIRLIVQVEGSQTCQLCIAINLMFSVSCTCRTTQGHCGLEFHYWLLQAALFALVKVNAERQSWSEEYICFQNLKLIAVIPQLFYRMKLEMFVVVANKIVNNLLQTGDLTYGESYFSELNKNCTLRIMAHSPDEYPGFGQQIILHGYMQSSINGSEKRKALTFYPFESRGCSKA